MKILVCLVAVFCLANAKPLDFQAEKVLKLKANSNEKIIKVVDLEFNVQLGNKEKDDNVLDEEAIYQPGKKNQIVYATVEYKGQPQEYITAILIEAAEFNKGGKPTITAGGIGQNFVTIQVASEIGEDNNFSATIYGNNRFLGIA